MVIGSSPSERSYRILATLEVHGAQQCILWVLVGDVTNSHKNMTRDFESGPFSLQSVDQISLFLVAEKHDVFFPDEVR